MGSVQIKFFGKQIFELRSSPENPSTSLANPDQWLIDWAGTQTSAGISVTKEGALKLSAVYACASAISAPMGYLPLNVYKESDNGNKNIEKSHPAQRLISREPNQIDTAFVFRERLVLHVLLWGNGYARIYRNGTYVPTKLKVIEPWDVDILHDVEDDALYYKLISTGEIVPQRNMLHFTGLSPENCKGKSVIEYAAENMGAAMATEKFGATFFSKGANMSGFMLHPGKLSPAAKSNIKNSFEKNHMGLDKNHGVEVLEEGMKFQPLTIPPESAQFILTKQHSIEDICRWFRVPPHKIQHLLRSTNNNIEHQGIEFVTDTLQPWAKKFELEFDRKLFTEKEKQNGLTYTKFNLNALMRGDVSTRSEFYNKGFQNGWFSINEIRRLEDMNPVKGGDTHYRPLNMQDIIEETPPKGAKTQNTQNNE